MSKATFVYRVRPASLMSCIGRCLMGLPEILREVRDVNSPIPGGRVVSFEVVRTGGDLFDKPYFWRDRVILDQTVMN